MINQFSRTEMIIGKAGIEKLKKSKVVVFGLGGVGSYTVEALARAGVGNLIIVDNDIVCVTNINRQLIATHKTVGMPKVQVMKERILDINPEANVITHQIFYLPDSNLNVIDDDADYIVDAIDTISAKIGLVMESIEKNIPIISSMGTGNKLHPEMLEITDIYKTSVCPLAKIMRYELRKRNVKNLTVCYSKEVPIKPILNEILNENSAYAEQNPILERSLNDIKKENEKTKNSIPGSISFVPSVAGLMIAGFVVRKLIGIE